MPTTYYTSANGVLLGERTDTGPRIDYVLDALGSVVAAVDENLNTTYTAAYKPYGDVLSSTGTAPRVTFVGSLNYDSAAGVPYAEYLAGARIGSTKSGRWTSIDPVWPRQSAYCYVLCNPVTWTDPTGLAQGAPPTNQYACLNCSCAVAPPDSQPGTTGWTVCCGGAECQACANNQPCPKDISGMTNIVQKCLCAHEQKHCSLLATTGAAGCGTFCSYYSLPPDKPRCGNTQGYPKQNCGECAANQAGVDCIFSSTNNKPCTNPHSDVCITAILWCNYLAGLGGFYKPPLSCVSPNEKALCKSIGVTIP
jgi:RHS repeat-associated protein